MKYLYYDSYNLSFSHFVHLYKILFVFVAVVTLILFLNRKQSGLNQSRLAMIQAQDKNNWSMRLSLFIIFLMTAF